MELSPQIGALREEYESLCAENHVAPSSHSELDETLRVLTERSSDPSSPHLARYAKRALQSLSALQARVKPRQTVTVHSSYSVGYGAKVAGYMELILNAYEANGVTLPGWIYVDELPIHSFNGSAFQSRKSAGTFCMLDHGLFRLLHHVCLAAYLMTNADDGGELDKPYQADPTLRIRAVQIVRETIEAYLINQAHPLILEENGWLDECGVAGACEISYALKLFVLAHELAHVRLGHLKRLASNVSSEERWQMEFEADLAAQETLCSIEASAKIPFSVVGGGFGFLLVDLMRQHVFRALHKIRSSVQSKSGSHPPSIQRIKRLDDYLTGFFSTRPRRVLAPLKLLQWIAIDLEQVSG